MRLLRPRSLSTLLTTGLLVLVVPLTLAVIRAATQIDRLAQDSSVLVQDGVELSGETQVLFRHLAAYERSSSLFLLLGDPQLLEASRNTHRQIVETVKRLGALPQPDDGSARLDTLLYASEAVMILLEFSEAGEPERGQRLTSRLEHLNESANQVSIGANQALESKLSTLENRASSTRRQLFVWLAGLVPVVLLLGLLFTLSVLRPLRQVDRAIAQLGGGTFSRPISISGPSDIESLGRQLEWLRVRLLELAQEKNRFLRHMSHELKTPLANIREGTDLLLDGAVGPLAPQQREVTGILRESGLKLQQLIENLLSYSAWQSRSAGLDRSAFSLAALIQAAFEAQRLAIAARKLDVRMDVEDLTITADRAKMRLVFDNLLSNALKFTPIGGMIGVRARRHGNYVAIDFGDSGPGIPPNERERIFEEFYTGSTPQSGPLKGSGIGLSVVTEFVAAHGGRVELASGEFPGAHFRIRLPLDGKRMASAGTIRRG